MKRIMLLCIMISFLGASCPKPSPETTTIGVAIAEGTCQFVEEIDPNVTLICDAIDAAGNVIKGTKVKVILPAEQWRAVKAKNVR